MNLSAGIVGLPNVGKSTLFNALLKRQIAAVAEYPYTTIEPNAGVVEVPDERLSLIADRLSIEKRVPAAIKFIDIAGLVKGAHQGEGLGNQFLAYIREVDAILHVVRAFENPNVTHVHARISPADDIKIVNMELELAGIKKPTIYVLNVDEKSIRELIFDKSKSTGLAQEAVVIPICAKLEAELSDLSIDEQKAYLKELGVAKSALDEVIVAAFKLLDLITFFTIAGGKQVQAWPVKVGTRMIEAAEVVHTDFALGFIVAEVCDSLKLVEVGGWQAAREKGLVKMVGRDEPVVDGMVVEFKFSV